MTKESDNEIRIRGVSPSLKSTLINIAKNTGYSTLTDFLKIKLREISDSSPENVKKSFKD